MGVECWTQLRTWPIPSLVQVSGLPTSSELSFTKYTGIIGELGKTLTGPRQSLRCLSTLGLPYALNQAGFFTGIFLLVVLCIATDWTIRLIVTNAKLSGRNSYIEIMHYCYGSSGRAAVSFFQFAFAFGGASHLVTLPLPG